MPGQNAPGLRLLLQSRFWLHRRRPAPRKVRSDHLPTYRHRERRSPVNPSIPVGAVRCLSFAHTPRSHLHPRLQSGRSNRARPEYLTRYFAGILYPLCADSRQRREGRRAGSNLRCRSTARTGSLAVVPSHLCGFRAGSCRVPHLVPDHGMSPE